MSTKAYFLTIRQAAAQIGVHESTIRRYADRGLIGVKRLPSGVRRLRRTDVEELAARMEASASPNDREEQAPEVAIEDVDEASVWRSDEELEQFLSLTYAERDRDR